MRELSVDTVPEMGIFKNFSLDLQWAFHWLETNDRAICGYRTGDGNF
jgi:hypothetical protein